MLERVEEEEKKEMNNFLNRTKRSFTLIEIIVVIIIIASLAAIVTPCVLKAIEKSKIAVMITDLRAIDKASKLHFTDTGRWPNTCGAICSTHSSLIADEGFSGWDGPYLERWPKTPWGHFYFFAGRNTFANHFGPNFATEIYIFVVNFADADKALKIDQAIDDGNIVTGNVRYNPASGILHYLVYQDR